MHAAGGLAGHRTAADIGDIVPVTLALLGTHGTEAKHTAVQENTNIRVVAAVAIDIGARYACSLPHALDLQAMPHHDINIGTAKPTSISFQFIHTRCETPSNAVRTATDCASRSDGMGVDCVGVDCVI